MLMGSVIVSYLLLAQQGRKLFFLLACGAKCTSCQIPNFSTDSIISQLQCTGCLPGYFLSQGKCVESCPPATFLSPQDNLTCTGTLFVVFAFDIDSDIIDCNTSMFVILWYLSGLTQFLSHLCISTICLCWSVCPCLPDWNFQCCRGLPPVS